MKKLIQKLVDAAVTAGALDETSGRDGARKRAWEAVGKAQAEVMRFERAYEIVCELQQRGHPCDCDFCEPLWQEVYRMMTAQPVPRCKACGYPS